MLNRMEQEEIYNRYKDGYSIQDIATEMDYARGTVSKYVEKMKVEEGGMSEEQKAIQLYDDGESPLEAVKKIGVSKDKAIDYYRDYEELKDFSIEDKREKIDELEQELEMEREESVDLRKEKEQLEDRIEKLEKEKKKLENTAEYQESEKIKKMRKNHRDELKEVKREVKENTRDRLLEEFGIDIVCDSCGKSQSYFLKELDKKFFVKVQKSVKEEAEELYCPKCQRDEDMREKIGGTSRELVDPYNRED